MIRGRWEQNLQDVVIGGVPVRQAIVPTQIESLDLLPTTLALARLDLKLMKLARREDRIRRVLDGSWRECSGTRCAGWDVHAAYGA